MINRVILVGRLTKDPELRKTPNGASVASFTVAVDNRRGPNGEKSASFIPCTIWNQQAENVFRFVRKGSLVGVDGRLNQRVYDSKDGRRVSTIEIICDSVQFLEKKDETAGPSVIEPSVNDFGYQPDPIPQALEVEPEKNNVSSIDVTDDDLPF